MFLKKRKLIPLILTLCIVVSALFGMHVTSYAESKVYFTKEEFGTDGTVYVAGNPDRFPMEYYNYKTKSYEGYFPEILKLISEKTGIAFTYIGCSMRDTRSQKADNGQAEIISCVNSLESNNVGYVGTSVPVVSDENGDTYYFAFTQITSEQLKDRINSALSSISEDEKFQISMSLAGMEGSQYPEWLLCVLVAIAALFLILYIIFRKRFRRLREMTEKSHYSDESTGIGNKAYFDFCFNQIEESEKKIYCVAYFGFDYSEISKKLGMEEAEQQMHFAASEITHNCDDSDIVARIGDGFSIIHMALNRSAAIGWATRMLGHLNIMQEDQEMAMSRMFRAGIYELSTRDTNSEATVFKAQQGYYRAVAEKTPYKIVDDKLLNKAENRMKMLADIRRAFVKDEFRIFLQITVDAQTTAIAGAEALSRWDHPEKGMMHPGMFIDYMDQEDIIKQFDFTVLGKACKQLEDWKMKNLNTYLSCNFNRVTLESEDFADKFIEVVDKFDIIKENLVIEITEASLEVRKDYFMANLRKCKEYGIRIALDDVGSGYTSFADIRDYPIDIIKIDASIVRGAITEKGIALLAGIIDLTKRMGMLVACEGVETKDQYILVKKLKCDTVQGYYFFRAIPTEVATDYMLENRKKHPEYTVTVDETPDDPTLAEIADRLTRATENGETGEEEETDTFDKAKEQKNKEKSSWIKKISKEKVVQKPAVSPKKTEDKKTEIREEPVSKPYEEPERQAKTKTETTAAKTSSGRYVSKSGMNGWERGTAAVLGRYRKFFR